MEAQVDTARYPRFAGMIVEILRQWPEHGRYLSISVGEREPALLEHSELLSEIIWKLCGGNRELLAGLISDYRYLCEKIVLPEEFYFRRHGHYRLSRFEDAAAEVYADREYMTRYMNGGLVSQVMWINHCRCMRHFVQEYLPRLPGDSHVLEIGPGHGLLLYLADGAPNLGALTAWDVSDASLELAASTLRTLGTEHVVNFTKRDLLDDAAITPDTADRFHGIVLSEVLEHLEEPLRALRVLFHLCRPGGSIWVNVPANSPCPDHLFLVNEPAEAVELVREAGFDVVDQAAYPMAGATLERARRDKLTVSCVVVGRKPQ